MKIPHLGVLLATTVNKASDWRGQEGRGGAGPSALCSRLKIEHLKPTVAWRRRFQAIRERDDGGEKIGEIVNGARF